MNSNKNINDLTSDLHDIWSFESHFYFFSKKLIWQVNFFNSISIKYLIKWKFLDLWPKYLKQPDAIRLIFMY